MFTASAASAPTHIAGFEVLAKIGEGGMGAVYKARDPDLDRIVAIKLLRHGFDNPEFRERLKLEARSAAALDSPHIVTVHSFGVHEGAPFLVMEYVPGTTLERLIKSRHQLSIVQKLRLMEALCEGLGLAHRRRVIHRDIKPSNLILSDGGVLKILDFGIAKAISRAGLTQTRAFMGTPNYMSPEQVLNAKTVDTRSDIFAVGAVFYELLTSELAFPGEQFAAVDAVLHREPEPLDRFCPTLDPQIAPVVSRALAKDVQQRYQTLTEMGREIVAIRQRLSDAETIVLPGSTRPAPPQDWQNVATVPLADIAATLREALGTPEPLDRQRGRRRRVAIWTSVALAFVIVAASAVWLYPVMYRPAQEKGPPTAGPAPAQPPGNGHTPSEPAAPDSRRLSDLHRSTLAALDHNEFNAAFRAVSEANTISPGDSVVQTDIDRTLQLLGRYVDRLWNEYPAGSKDAHVRNASARRRSADRYNSDGRKMEAIQLLLDARDELLAADRPRPAPVLPGDRVAGRPQPPPQTKRISSGEVAGSTAATEEKQHEPKTGLPSQPPGSRPPDNQASPDREHPPTPEKPSLPSPAADSSLIDAALDQYISAYEHQDAAALQSVWPTMPDDLRRTLSKNKSYRLKLVNKGITINGDTARVTCTRQISVQPLAGKGQDQTVATLIELQRHAGRWEITSIR